jgi:drug/metabolite transporter (DMT)-like permease
MSSTTQPTSTSPVGSRWNTQATAYTLLLLTAFFWGANVVVAKMAIGHISPMFLTSVRWAFACIALSAIGWRQVAVDWPIVRRNAFYLLALGAVGFAVFNNAVYTAVTFTSGINVSVEQGAVPVFIFLANFLVFRLSVSAPQILGLILSIAGVIIVSSHGHPVRILALDVNTGDAIMISACVAYAGYAVALRKKPAIDWRSLMIAMSAGAFIASLPFAAAEFAIGKFVEPDRQGWAIVLITTIFPSILAQMFFVKGVELIGANRAGLFINLVPVFGMLLSVLIVGETLRPYHGVAVLLVFGGIWLAERRGQASQPA